MDKVWIVTEGEYSDYHIERVFLNKDHAEAYAEVRRTGGHHYSDDSVKVEEWVVNADRNLTALWYVNEYRGELDAETVDESWDVPSDVTSVDDFFSTNLRTYVYAPSREHAIKVAAERFAQHRAMEAGIA